jgi:hypothetical protein
MSNKASKLRFERKRGISEDYRRYNFDTDKQEMFQASVQGGSVVVKDVKQARRLFLIVGFYRKYLSALSTFNATSFILSIFSATSALLLVSG